MLSLQTLTTIEALLMSRSHPVWGEFMPLAQVIGEVQQAKAALQASRAQPTPNSGDMSGAPADQPLPPPLV